MIKVKNESIQAITRTFFVLLAVFSLYFPFSLSAQELENPNGGQGNAAIVQGGSDSFQMDGTMSWYTDGMSSNFQMTLAPEEGSASTDSTTTQTSTTVVAPQAAPNSGNQRSIPKNPAKAAKSPSEKSAAQPTHKQPAKPSALTKAVERRALERQQAGAQKLGTPAKTNIKSTGTVKQSVGTKPSVGRPTSRAIHRKGIFSLLRGTLGFDPDADASVPLSTGWVALSGVLAFSLGRSHMKSARKHRQASRRRTASIVGHALCIFGVLCLLGASLSFTNTMVIKAHAASTVPTMRMYNGNLRNAQGVALKTAHTIRFSYWNTADALPAHRTATGSINTAAPAFLGWVESHTVTPNTMGAFSVKLGSEASLLNFETLSVSDAQNLHMQVEVKPAGAPDSSYELMDVNPANPAVDRSAILPVPFARNADLLDLHDVGTGSGSIPLLGSGGLIPVGAMPGGTNRDDFAIDADGSASEPGLRFGQSLAQRLSYSTSLGRFNFADDVHIQGNLTLTGLVNGVDVTALASGTGAENMVDILHPSYEGASYQGDGSENVGQLSVVHDAAGKQNSYVWTSTRPTLQDYDIVLKVSLPADFIRWQSSGSLIISYRSTDATIANNALDVRLSDTNGNPVTLTGSLSLAHATWRTSSFVVDQGTWTPGKDLLLKLTVKARNQAQIHLGAVQLRMVR